MFVLFLNSIFLSNGCNVFLNVSRDVKISVKNSWSSYCLFLYWNQYFLFISVRVSQIRDFFNWRGNFGVPSPFRVRQMPWLGSWFTQWRASRLTCRICIDFSYFSVLYVTVPLPSLFVELLVFQCSSGRLASKSVTPPSTSPSFYSHLLECISSLSMAPSTFHPPEVCWNFLSARDYFLFFFYCDFIPIFIPLLTF